jgi:two-component system CheB/CheR fusion protein
MALKRTNSRKRKKSLPKLIKGKALPTKDEAVSSDRFSSDDEFPIVAVGASAGGYEAFSELLKGLPADTGMAFVFVQHLDPTHTSVLPEILSRVTKIPVEEVTDGLRVKRNRVYVIPANTTMVLTNGELRLGVRNPDRGQHLPIDRFFYSLAENRDNQAIGVILSGTASDGSQGCRAIKACGGITFAQDEQSAKFSSMPGSAIHTGCVDFVLPPREIARELVRIGKHPYVAARPAPADRSLGNGKELHELLSMVRDSSGVDFNLYKQSTLQRRIRRRIVVHKLEGVKDYLRYVRRNPKELDELYRDLLIHVTGFFRDPEAFDVLKDKVFPALLQSRKLEDSPIRIWVPGCSTGEEVYSIAISILEFLWQTASSNPALSLSTKGVQIFATDISEAALDRARMGLYSESAITDLSPSRLSRFFVRLDGGYQINKSLREMCVFARQDITQDPPFSNLDLITCRNLLIYLAAELQKRVIPTLHYGLKRDGYLMLGASESLGAFSDHFTLIDKKQRIYQKRTTARLITYFTPSGHMVRPLELPRTSTPPVGTFTVDKEIDRVLVNRFVPASIVVNEQMEIVQFRGRTGAYLEPAAGNPTFNLSKMAREGLLVDLRAALNKAKKTNSTARAEHVRVKSVGHTQEVDLEVIPVRGQGKGERFYVVVFENSLGSHQTAKQAKRQTEARERATNTREHGRLKGEVGQLREQLESLIEEHETTSEEFKSANEEVLSANEELQSTNEELETAKEELQSSNEELTTLNEELQNRNTELSLANSDLINLLGNVNIPVVMVGNDLRIRRFTPPAQKLLNLIPTDIGRRLQEIRPNLDVENIETTVQSTIENATLSELEVHEKDGSWYLMRVRPYKTWEHKIDGAVISFQDIDDLKRSVNATRDYADMLIENAREAIVIADSNLRISSANPAFYRMFGLKQNGKGKGLDEITHTSWLPDSLRERLLHAMRKDVRIDDVEIQHEYPSLGLRTVLFNARRIEPARGQQMLLVSIQDVTENRRYVKDLQTHTALLELASDAVLVRDLHGVIQLWNHGAERLYGWSRAEAIGKTVYELLKTRFPAPQEEIFRILEEKSYWEGELVHTRKDGEERVVASRWSLHKGGNTRAVLELNTDITERKRAEEQLRRLAAQLMQAQDDERRRIARDLHDSTGQKLAALKMSMQRRNPALLDGDVTMVDEILQEIRTLAQLLHPPLIEEAGLLSAMRWLVEGFSSRAGIEVTLNAAQDFERLPGDIEIALFRVVQEALNNILRHSGAKKAIVEMTHQADGVRLKVTDDGRGMKSTGSTNGERGQRSKRQKEHVNAAPSFGVGLLGMKERLAQLGGNLVIDSDPKGTTIEARVPLAASRAAN